MACVHTTQLQVVARVAVVSSNPQPVGASLHAGDAWHSGLKPSRSRLVTWSNCALVMGASLLPCWCMSCKMSATSGGGRGGGGVGSVIGCAAALTAGSADCSTARAALSSPRCRFSRSNLRAYAAARCSGECDGRPRLLCCCGDCDDAAAAFSSRTAYLAIARCCSCRLSLSMYFSSLSAPPMLADDRACRTQRPFSDLGCSISSAPSRERRRSALCHRCRH